MPYKEKPIKQIRKTRAYSTTPRKRQIDFTEGERKTNKLDQVDLLCMVVELDVMTHLKKYCSNEGLTELQESEMISRYNQYCDLYKKYPERRFQKGDSKKEVMNKKVSCDACGVEKSLKKTETPEDYYFVACMAQESQCGHSVYYCCHCVRELRDYGYLIQRKDYQKRVVICSDCSEDDEICEILKSSVEFKEEHGEDIRVEQGS